MAVQVVNGATLMCSGAFPPGTCSLIVTPEKRVTAGGQPAANIMDYVPLKNLPTFGMCMMPANPVVASATAAALGVLTPMPCIPNTVAPWTPGSPTVPIAGQPALNNSSQCMCSYGGVITVMVPGQTTVLIP